MKWEPTRFPLGGGWSVVKCWDDVFDTKEQAQAFADQLNTKCLSTDPAWAAKAEERMAERVRVNGK